MRKIFFLFGILFIISSFLVQCKSGISRLDERTLLVKSSCDYLLLPAEDTGREVKMTMQVEGVEDVTEFVFRPAKEKIDYWVPVDIGDKKDQKITYTFSEPMETNLFWDRVKLSNEIPQLVVDSFRPLYHFTPQRGWMNDPNGMVYYKGEYHLFYQHNPYGTRWQNMSWGHAVSQDLVRWEHRPIALWPDTLGTIFSGCMVVDENNTAGLQTGDEKTLLAFFTHSEKKGQMQSLAFSNDRGVTWEKYAQNPLLKHASERDFRDPKVFWHAPTHKWIMILAVGQKMEIYSSKNALQWQFESQFGETYGAHGGVWECPDLLELPVVNEKGKKKWVLICNLNPGGPAGGSGTQYFIGSFDGSRFVCDDTPETIKWMDWGKDHYAAVSWSNAPQGKCIMIGWMSNWDYANDLPTKEHRNGATIPREVTLCRDDKGYSLVSLPVDQVASLFDETKSVKPFVVKDSHAIDHLIDNNKGAYEMNITLENGATEIIGFRLFNSKGESVHFSLNEVERKLSIDRRNSGKTNFSSRFAAETTAPLQVKKEYRLRLLIDRTSIECFEGDGKIAMTNLIFPSEPYNRINFYAKGGEYTVSKFEVKSCK